MPSPLDQYFFTIDAGEGIDPPASAETNRVPELPRQGTRPPPLSLTTRSELSQLLLQRVSDGQRASHGPPARVSHKRRKITPGQYFKGK